MDKTLLKGLMVLEAVTDVDNPPRTIDALAARVGLTRSNTHRTLQTLIHAGYVIRTTRAAAIAARCGCLSWPRGSWRSWTCASWPRPMRTLADQTGETVHLSVLDGFDVVYVDKIDSPQPIRAYSMIGGRAPAYAVATGKALLAYQSDGYVERYADQLQRHTPATIVTMPLLRTSCARWCAPATPSIAANGAKAWRAGRGAVQQPGPARGGRGHLRAAGPPQRGPDEAAGAGRGGLCAGDIPGHGVSRRLPGTVAPASASAAAMRRAWSRARRAFTSMDVVQK